MKEETTAKNLIAKAEKEARRIISRAESKALVLNKNHIDDMKATFIETINTTVNGKIITLTNEFRAYIKEDNEWKAKAEPVIKMEENLQGASKVMLYLSGLILVMGGAILLITNVFKK